MSALPPALINRILSDAASFHSASTSSSLPDATASGRSYATRRLLAMTPAALDTVEKIMSSQSDKDALSAASLVLSKSPATRDEDLSSLTPELSTPLVQALSSALSSFASAFACVASLHSPSSEPLLQPVSDPSVSYPPKTPLSNASHFQLQPEEPSVITEPLPVEDLPFSDSTQLTSEGLVNTSQKESPMPRKKTEDVPVKRGPGRPPGSKNASKAASEPAAKPKKKAKPKAKTKAR